MTQPDVSDAAPVLPAPQGVPGWTVEPWQIMDGGGVARRPGLRASWSAAAAADARGIRIALRRQGETGAGTVVTTAQVADGEYIHSAGVIPGQAYQMRARLVVDRATTWSAWGTVTAPDLRAGYDDFTASMQGKIDEITATATAVAQAELIADTRTLAENLVLDGVFEQGFTRWPTSDLPADFIARDLTSGEAQLNSMPAPRALRLVPVSHGLWGGTGLFPVTVGEDIRVSFDHFIPTDGIGLRVVLRFYDKTGAAITGQSLVIERTAPTGGAWQPASGIKTVPAGAVDAMVYVQAYGASATDDSFVTNIRALRGQEAYASGGLQVISQVAPAGAHSRVDLRARATGLTHTGEAALTLDALSDGSSAATITADLFQVRTNTSTAVPFYVLGDNVYFGGIVEAEFLRVNSLLTISDTGALAAGKIGPDDSSDGLFLGQVKDGAGTRFAFSASRTTPDGLLQEVSLTPDGFRLVNAQFFYNAATPDPVVRRTTNLSVTTLTGAQMIRVSELIGGGGGGRGSSGVGGNGGATTVTLYDGSTVKKTITAAGGAGGSMIAIDGRDATGGAGNNPSNRGGGGGGATWWDANGSRRYGRGGAAGARGGLDWIDVSDWTTPRIAITIGAGGSGGSGTTGGAAGVGGAASYQVMTAASIPASPGIFASEDGASMPVTVEAVTDDAGLLTVDLLPGNYTMRWLGPTARHISPLSVPDEATARLEDLLVAAPIPVRAPGTTVRPTRGEAQAHSAVNPGVLVIVPTGPGEPGAMYLNGVLVMQPPEGGGGGASGSWVDGRAWDDSAQWIDGV